MILKKSKLLIVILIILNYLFKFIKIINIKLYMFFFKFIKINNFIVKLIDKFFE